MHVDKYNTTKLSRHIWLGLAVFFLVFTSNPVKKFIHLTLFGYPAPIEAPAGEHLSSTYVKVCTIVDRHQLSSKSVQTTEQSTDTNLVLILSALVSFALLYFVRTTPREENYHQHPFISQGTVPLYLSVRKLQV